MNIKKLCALALLLSLGRVWASESATLLATLEVVGRNIIVRLPGRSIVLRVPVTSVGDHDEGMEIAIERARTPNSSGMYLSFRHEASGHSGRVLLPHGIFEHLRQPAPAAPVPTHVPAPAALAVVNATDSGSREQKEFKAPSELPQQ